MRLYTAGPMTGLPEHNFPMFDRAKEILQGMGHRVVSPADLNRILGYDVSNQAFVDGKIDPQEYAELFKADVTSLLACDGMVVLPGWVKSRGAKLEFALARMLRLPVFRLDFDLGMLARLDTDYVYATVIINNPGEFGQPGSMLPDVNNRAETPGSPPVSPNLSPTSHLSIADASGTSREPNRCRR